MERKIGEIFSYKGGKYIVQKDSLKIACGACIFAYKQVCGEVVGECEGTERTDKTDIIAARLR